MKTNVTNKKRRTDDSQDLKAEILTALLTVSQEDIRVTIIGDKAILDGAVESTQEKLSAEKVVRKIPQIKEVENNLRIEWLC